MIGPSGQYPFGDDFQSRIIALALVDKTFLARNAVSLRPAYFTAPYLAEIARVLIGHFETYRSVPSRDLFREVARDAAKARDLKPAVAEGWRDAVDRIVAVPAGDLGYVREKVLDWARSQVIASAAMQLAELYEEAQRSGRPEIDAMRKLMVDAVTACSERSDNVVDYFDDVVPRVYADQNVRRVTTGYPTLDAVLEGGIDPGEEFVFLGGPSAGKTSLLVGMVRGMLLQRYRVLVVTVEVSPRRWAARIDRAVTGKTREEILADPRAAARQIQRLRQVRGRCMIKGFPSGSATIQDIESYIEELRDTEDFIPDALVVDYLDELKIAGSDFRLGLVENYRQFRGLVQRLDVPGATASQAGKQSEGKAIVSMRDAAEAYAKNFVADIVVALCQTEEEAAMMPYPECRLYGAKNREGKRRFNLPYIFRAERGIVVPAPEPVGDGAAAPAGDVVRYGAAV